MKCLQHKYNKIINFIKKNKLIINVIIMILLKVWILKCILSYFFHEDHYNFKILQKNKFWFLIIIVCYTKYQGSHNVNFYFWCNYCFLKTLIFDTTIRKTFLIHININVQINCKIYTYYKFIYLGIYFLIK